MNGQIVESGSDSSIPLETGGNKATVELIDLNDEVVNTYTVMVMRPLDEQWDIGDTVRAIHSGFDITDDGHFDVKDVSEMLGLIEHLYQIDE